MGNEYERAYRRYFTNRGVEPPTNTNQKLPRYLRDRLANVNAKILEIGCGYGNLLFALQNEGFKNIIGMDVSEQAVSYCTRHGLPVQKGNILSYVGNEQYDVVLMSHVLEHLPKDNVIPMLNKIRDTILAPKGELYLMVPNAQSNTNCYWAYEDFTHNMLFTAGSLLFVLREAGFQQIEFLDADGLYDFKRRGGWEYWKRKWLLKLYIKNRLFWNKITGSSYHRPSPLIFTYELKCVAIKDAEEQYEHNMEKSGR